MTITRIWKLCYIVMAEIIREIVSVITALIVSMLMSVKSHYSLDDCMHLSRFSF